MSWVPFAIALVIVIGEVVILGMIFRDMRSN